VEAHDGRLWAAGKEALGSVFLFTVPMMTHRASMANQSSTVVPPMGVNTLLLFLSSLHRNKTQLSEIQTKAFEDNKTKAPD
jgi:hypothetical protein